MNSNDETKLMQQVVGRKNMVTAYRRVVSNAGASGIDEMSVSELRVYLKENWPLIKEQLLGGTYRPQPVRGVEIPKPLAGNDCLGYPR